MRLPLEEIQTLVCDSFRREPGDVLIVNAIDILAFRIDFDGVVGFRWVVEEDFGMVWYNNSVWQVLEH